MLGFLTREPYNFKKSEHSIYPQFQHPVRWGCYEGHYLAKNADWLPEFDIVGLHAERDQEQTRVYSVIVGIKRDPYNMIYNVVFSSESRYGRCSNLSHLR